MEGSSIQVDVLVVGLGPAGACAAFEAAREGLSVLAIERNHRPGLPVQCAEFVPMMIGMELDEILRAQVQPISEMINFVENDKPEVTENFRGHMISRDQFDQALIEQARQAGVDCRFGTPLRGFDDNGIAHTISGMAIDARVVIAGDGPRSVVGRWAGVVNQEIVETRQICVDLKKPHQATDIFLSSEIVGGYGWLFPKGSECNLGLGVVRAQRHKLKPLLESLHRQLIDQGRVGAEIHHHTGGAIPVGGIAGLFAKKTGRNILFCGDAAGLTNPITGAGINAAILSGKLAGECAAGLVEGDHCASEDYCDEINALFGASLDRACQRRQTLMRHYEIDGDVKKEDLRKGWIAYDQYWCDDETQGSLSASDHAGSNVSKHALHHGKSINNHIYEPRVTS